MRQALVILIVLQGCGGSGYAAHEPYSSAPPNSTATYSSDLGAPEVPNRTTSGANLTVRPDALGVVFAVRARRGDARGALTDAQTATAELARKLSACSATPLQAAMRGVRVQPLSSYVKSSTEEKPSFEVSVDGELIVPMAATQDYWMRATLVACLVQAAEEQAKQTRSNTLALSVQQPKAQVRDLDVYRAKLQELWTKRAREFAAGAQSPGFQLVLTECVPPAQITQESLSLEEVALSMPLNCKLLSQSAK